METFQDFTQRINSLTPHLTFSSPTDFVPSDNINQKVKADNLFKPYFGDTIVFNLCEDEKSAIKRIANPIYDGFSDYFAEKVKDETYHVTLHGLCSDNDLSKIAEKIFYNELNIKDLLKGCECSHRLIDMKSTAVFNMVNTSIVLGFIPKNEIEYAKLMNLKQLFNKIYPSSCPFTPHVTLAYFNKTRMNSEKKAALYELIKKLSSTQINLSLNMNNLFYQKFINMNHYYNIFKIENTLFNLNSPAN